MGILDLLENSPAFKGALGQLEGAVLPVVLSEVLGNGSQGGLNAIVAKLQQAGFGDQVKSWIGNGQNLPITAEQLQQALGSDTAKQLAADSISRSISSARCWPNCCRRPSTMPARTATFRPRHNVGKASGSGTAANCSGTGKNPIIALKNLQNLRACHVRMDWPNRLAPC